MYTLISGSPKIKDSNSMYFINTIKSKLDNYNVFELKKDSYDVIMDSITKSDVTLFAFPLYVDSPSSITLSFLDYIYDNNIDLSNKIVYVICNCGFREGEQNKTAINIMKRWCEKAHATYASSIMIGAGEIVGKDKFKFISRKALKDINKFANIVKSKEITEDIITTMDLFNNKMYCYIANMSWNKKGKKNNLSSSDLRIK